MRLLLDENLAPRLALALADIYPGTVHVRDLGLASTDDRSLWDYAAQRELTIVSKDSDFRQMAFLFGHPPKVIGIRLGNCSTDAVESLLRMHLKAIVSFDQDGSASFLAIP